MKTKDLIEEENKLMWAKMVDPPSGWRYGFPRRYLPKEGQSMRDWFIECGYPEKDIDWALQHIRFWDDGFAQQGISL